MKIFKISLAVLSIIMASVMTTACHTMQGAGKDIKKGGAALERSAADNTHY